MRFRRVRLTEEAVRDIDAATHFYETVAEGLGGYFFSAITADLEALEFFGGIHEERFGYHCCPSKRFPFLIYYSCDEVEVTVVAVLDTRKSADSAFRRLDAEPPPK